MVLVAQPVTDPTDLPELAFDSEWSESVIKARKNAGLNQSELAAKVGTSQNMISLIESNGVGSSTFVLPICKELKIPPPAFYASSDQKRWADLGHRLRLRDPKKFTLAMALAESLVDGLEEPATQNGEIKQSVPKK